MFLYIYFLYFIFPAVAGSRCGGIIFDFSDPALYAHGIFIESYYRNIAFQII